MSLHANWDGSTLHVWGADDAAMDRAGYRSHDELRAALAEVSGDALLASVATPGELSLWLPSADGTLAATVVPTLRFAPADATDFLATCPPAPAAPGTEPSSDECQSCSDSVRFWAVLARLVMRHIADQQFFPDLEPHADPGALAAVWRLLIDPKRGVEQLERLASAMPPVCRAMTDERFAPVDGDVATVAGQLVESFILETTNAVLRRDVTHDPFFARVHQLATEESAAPEVKWLSGLLAADPVIRVDPFEGHQLAEQVRAWVGQLDEGRADAPWRLAFELIEPETDEPDDGTAADEDDQPLVDATWRLKFLLDPPGEDVTPVDAAELWAGNGTGAILGRRLAVRRDQFRNDLALAAEVCPPLQKLLDAPAPAEAELSTAEAHLFIRQWSPQLQAREFRVVLPEWASLGDRRPGLLLDVSPTEDWPFDDDASDDEDGAFAAGSSRRRRGNRGPEDLGTGGAGRFGLDSLVDFDWRVAVGDMKLTVDEFRRLAESRSPLVRYRGQWLQLDTEAADRAARALATKKKGKITLAEAFRTAFVGAAGLNGAAGDTAGDAGAPVVGLTGTSWVQQLLEQTPSARMKALQQPQSFVGQLRPYQLRGLDWLWFLHRLGIGGCLADDMGLGKTIQLIALMLQDHNGRNGSNNGDGGNGSPKSQPTLLFAPTSVVGNWARELQRFAPPMKVLVHHGPERLRGEAFVEAAAQHHVVITTYALAHRDAADLAKPAWRRVVLDEAQKVKNPYAASTQAIRALAGNVPHRVALTGTPVENRLSELWSIMEVLNPGLLGSAADFREQFAVPIEKLADREQAERLRKLIRPFVLRRVKDDPQVAVDLPEKMEMKVYCNLSPEQAALYERITSEMLGQVDAADGIRRRALVLAALTRLKQVCDHPALLTKENDRGGAVQLDGRSGKCERLVEMLEEVLEEGDRALIFTQFKQMGDLLEQLVTQRLRVPVLFLHGGTPAKQRDAMTERFQQKDGDARIFILSLRAGGLGLNLTAANHVFHFDRWWNPAVEQQATDRAHRIGQTRRVQVHKFVCAGTVEERIDQLLSEKQALADRIVSSGDEWLTGLSTDELRKALQLSETAVAEF